MTVPAMAPGPISVPADTVFTIVNWKFCVLATEVATKPVCELVLDAPVKVTELGLIGMLPIA